MNYLTIDGVVRKLWKADAAAYADHLLRLDPASRRNRFGGAVADSFLRHHADSAFDPGNVINGFFADGVLRGAAELRPFGVGQAEAAFGIERPWQSHGVGTELLERALLAARNRGVKQLHITCLLENQRMQQLAPKFDAEMRRDFDSGPAMKISRAFAEKTSFTGVPLTRLATSAASACLPLPGGPVIKYACATRFCS